MVHVFFIHLAGCVPVTDHRRLLCVAGPNQGFQQMCCELPAVSCRSRWLKLKTTPIIIGHWSKNTTKIMVNMQFLILPFANIARPKGDHPKNTKGDVSSDGRQTCHRDGMTSKSQAKQMETGYK